MKNIYLTILIFLIMFTFNTTSQVLLKFNNQTDKQISIKVTTGEQISPVESYVEIYSALIPANTLTQEFIKLKAAKKGYKVIVTGAIVNLGNFKFWEQTIVQKNLEFTIPLTLNVEQVGSDNTSYETLMKTLNYTPPKGSEKVMQSDIAFKAFFGGLFLVKDSVEIDRLEPTVLKAEVNPVQYGSINRTVSVFLSGNFLSDTKLTAPGIASVNANIQRDELYKLTYGVNDIGTLPWSPPQGKSIAQLFTELNETDKIGWIKRYIADSSLKMFQYDHIYLFKTMNISMEKFKRTATTIDASVPIFFSNNTAFKKEEGETFTNSATTTVLNVWSGKDLTYLLAQGAKEYLEKQKSIIQQASTNKDAANVVNAALKIDDNELLPTAENATKSQIITSIDSKIIDLELKINEQFPDSINFDFEDMIHRNQYGTEIVLMPKSNQRFPIHLVIDLSIRPRSNSKNSTYWWACTTELNGIEISNSKREENKCNPPCSYMFTTIINDLPSDRKLRIRVKSLMSNSSDGETDIIILQGSKIYLR